VLQGHARDDRYCPALVLWIAITRDSQNITFPAISDFKIYKKPLSISRLFEGKTNEVLHLEHNFVWC
jgi:hypothetical protein